MYKVRSLKTLRCKKFHDGIIQNDGVSVTQNFAADNGQGSGFGGAGGKRTSSQVGRFWGWLNWQRVGFGKNKLINLWQPIPQKGINSLNADQTNETGLSTKGIQNLAPKFWNTEQKKYLDRKKQQVFFLSQSRCGHIGSRVFVISAVSRALGSFCFLEIFFGLLRRLLFVVGVGGRLLAGFQELADDLVPLVELLVPLTDLERISWLPV